MNVDVGPLKVKGRYIQPPDVLYGINSIRGVKPVVSISSPYPCRMVLMQDHQSIQNGGWNVTGQRFREPAKIVAWAVVSFDFADRSGENARKLVQGLLRNMKQLGKS